MKIIRKREIILERTRQVTIKFNNESKKICCFGCEKNVRFVTVDEAAAVTQTTSREIFRLVEDGQIHFQETASGRLLICFASLMNLSNENQKFLSKSNE